RLSASSGSRTLMVAPMVGSPRGALPPRLPEFDRPQVSRATKSVGRAILNYIRHLDDDGYIERLRTRAPLATLARTAAELVASDDHTVVSRATLFAQDGCRLLVWRDFRRELAEA